MNIIELLSQNQQMGAWLDGLQTGGRYLLIGLSSSSKVVALAAAYQECPKLVIVTSHQNQADKLATELSALLGSEVVYPFFTDDSPVAEFAFSSKDRSQSRIEALRFLLDKEKQGILITTSASFRIFLPEPGQFQAACLSLAVGDELEMGYLTMNLLQAGYKKVSRVLSQGEFSQRGDILDIFEMTSDMPYRLEFFGDEIDGIRLFDVEKQTSLQNLDRVVISPASEFILGPKNYQLAAKKLQAYLSGVTDNKQISYIKEVLEDFEEGYRHPDYQKLLSYLYDKETSLADYLPEDCQLIFDDFHQMMDKYAFFEKEATDVLTHDLQNGKGLGVSSYFANPYSFLRQYKPATFLSTFQKGLGNVRFDAIYSFTQHPMQEFFNQIPLLKEEIRRYQAQDYTVIIQTQSEKTLQDLQETFRQYELDIPFSLPHDLQPGKTQITFGSLGQGFQFLDEKIAYITEREIFQKKIKRPLRRSKAASNAERLKDYNELEKGDYVVHHVHGVGQFLGIETIEVSGVHRDYLTIQYQNADRISLPIDQIDLLSKYTSSDGKTPKINKLNDGRFQRTKQKVAKQVEDIADELIQLYAERSQLEGFAFSPDDSNQEEFETYFSYAETEDQLRSIAEIKKDMEQPAPMDRLLVGDVGFGKTEVAMRAAFKAVNDGKQVAILVPTTVLAQQHYVNFVERFSAFPVTVDVLSRFRSKAEQAQTLEKLKKGRVDIIIGTHRLLSQDVIFSDLGLLIIDEEQRFGVKHKERLKDLKKKIDVLTLTATPIPRTLHMSMLGIRDLSIIETPPTNRYPVQTYVMETNASVIRDAVLREMDRGGQVYYLYNKVDTIEQKVSELQDLIPEASIGFVHGQMSEIQLENTLYAFVEGEYDILVTTTIIETGVDIPNANTLFIENADHMGLSTLYQLRGRVGRSSRIAYAYFMYRPDKSLTEVSEKRLEAIKGFTELGSGFKIAMQDLSIRGAGNLLGAAQSGFIDSVGYELYSQLLEEAVLAKQGKQKKREKSNTEINLFIDAYLPSDYISDQRQKIEMYKKMKNIDSRVNYEHLQDELIDRFGDYPDVVAYLLEIALLKSFADSNFTQSIELKNQQVTVTFETRSAQIFLTQDYFQALSVTSLKARLSEDKGKMQVIFDAKNKKDNDILEALIAFSESLQDIRQQKETP